MCFWHPRYAGEHRASNLAVINIKLISGYAPDDASVKDLRTKGLGDGVKGVEVDGKNVDIFINKVSCIWLYDLVSFLMKVVICFLFQMK